MELTEKSSQKVRLAVFGVVAVSVAAAGFVFIGLKHDGAVGALKADLMTPPGITTQQIAADRTYSAFNPVSFEKITKTTYADADGRTLYVSDASAEQGKPQCGADCDKVWTAVKAAPGAQPSGSWTLSDLPGGGKQWGLQGKPLYSCAKDTDVGQNKCDDANAGWHAALADIGGSVRTPPGIAVTEVVGATGYALVNAQGLTLYTYDGNITRDKDDCFSATCEARWTPLSAPGLSRPVGDFTIVSQADGTRQWAYKGRGLYAFSGDLELGDASGSGLGGRWSVALIARNFMPPGIGIRRAPGQADVLVNAEGMTLYRLTAHRHSSTGNGLPRSIAVYPDIGRAIGTKYCEGESQKLWRPVVAPQDAVPSGNWSIMTRSDGSKQWAYKGYAMYTYTGDKKPGDINGHEIIEIRVDDGSHPEVALNLPQRAADALYWIYMEP